MIFGNSNELRGPGEDIVIAILAKGFGPRHANHRPVLTLDMDGVNMKPGLVKGGRRLTDRTLENLEDFVRGGRRFISHSSITPKGELVVDTAHTSVRNGSRYE